MAREDKGDRRKIISFKDNVRDNILLQWSLDSAEEYGGYSAYIKSLISKDMEVRNDSNKPK